MSLALIDETISLINAASVREEIDNVELLSAVGYEKQKFLQLVTKIDDERINISQIPLLGLGVKHTIYPNIRNHAFLTWLSKPGLVASAVEYALKIGYRHIDAAAVYGNEKEVGQGIAAAIKAGIKRSDIFITSKLWNTKHHPKDILPALKQTLSDLGLEYVDLYLVHWPLTLKSGADNFPKRADGLLDYGEIIPHEDTWKGMEECVRLGLTKHIGLSNFNQSQIDNILSKCSIRPTVLQCECHPYLAQNELIKYCNDQNIIFEAYSPLGNPARPSGWDHSLQRVLDDSEIQKIAKKYNASVADCCIRYQIDRNVAVIPKSTTLWRIKSNFEVWSFELNQDELKRINALDKNQRYGIPTVINQDGKRVIRDGSHPFWPWKDTIYG